MISTFTTKTGTTSIFSSKAASIFSGSKASKPYSSVTSPKSGGTHSPQQSLYAMKRKLPEGRASDAASQLSSGGVVRKHSGATRSVGGLSVGAGGGGAAAPVPLPPQARPMYSSSQEQLVVEISRDSSTACVVQDVE